MQVNTSYSPLQWQTRCVTLLPGKGTQEPVGYAIGGVDGSLGVVPFANMEQAKRLEITKPASNGLESAGVARRGVSAVARLPNHTDKFVAGAGDGRMTVWSLSRSLALSLALAVSLSISLSRARALSLSLSLCIPVQ